MRCLFCKKSFIDNSFNKTKKYCSEICSNSYRQLQKEQTCSDCNKQFKHYVKRKYCDDCKDKNRVKGIDKHCIFCGLEFQDTTKDKSKLYCSETCGNSYRQSQKEQVCSGCNIKFKHSIKRKYCDKCVHQSRIKPIKKKCLWCKKQLINKNYCDSDCHYKYNKQKYIDKAREWKKKNHLQVLKGNSLWKKRKYNEDPLYKLNTNLRNHLRYVLKRYTKTGKIHSTKDYGISVKRIIKRFEKDAGFSFSQQPQKAMKYINEREIDHITAVHKMFSLDSDYDSNSKELLEKIKKLYSSKNLKLVKLNEHRYKSAKEMSIHHKISSYLKDKKEIEIREISKEDAEAMVDFFHYSDVMPRSTKLYLGGFLDNILIGIMTLGWGVQPERTIKKMFPSLTQQNYFEIGKLCLDERLPKNSGSKFISSCFKYLLKSLNHSNIKLIYSWSDGLLGKPGFIYQASNFLYGGYIWSKRYFTKEGYKIHPRSSKYLCEDNAQIEKKFKLTWLTDSYMENKGIKLIQGLQFRYCYFLCSDKSKRNLLKESKFKWNLAYPKIEDLKWKIKKNGGYIGTKQQPYYSESLTAQETLRII